MGVGTSLQAAHLTVAKRLGQSVSHTRGGTTTSLFASVVFDNTQRLATNSLRSSKPAKIYIPGGQAVTPQLTDKITVGGRTFSITGIRRDTMAGTDTGFLCEMSDIGAAS